MVFNRDAPEYRTCCCHVKTCATVIGLLQLLYLILTVADGGSDYASTHDVATRVLFFGGLAGLIIGGLILILFFIGICKENPNLLIPFLIVQIFMLAILVLAAIGIILVLTGVIDPDTKEVKQIKQLAGHKEDKTRNTGRVISYLIYAFCQIWFFMVVYKCYRFFRDQRRAGYIGGTPTVAYHA